MRDMFYNYDTCIDKKEYPIPFLYHEPKRILENNAVLSLVLDAKGNEMGICARQFAAFSLYFMLEGCVEGSSIEELVKNSSVVFTLTDYWHKVVLEKVIDSEACFDNDTIRVDITESEASALKQETYFMNLSLIWPDGKYVLYKEDNGFLTIK